MRRYGATNLINRIFSLVLLLGLAALVLLTPVFSRGLSDGQSTFCLGFILLFGYYLAKLLEGFRLPSITSYIIAGIICGPFVLNLLSPAVVDSLQLFDDVALSIIALILVVFRGICFYLGTWTVARMTRDLRPYSRSMWSGFLAQAGVTIGLASLIEKRMSWGADFYTIVLAMVAINQLIGPVLLKWLLERNREAGGMDRTP